MGELKVVQLSGKDEKANYIYHLLKDIDALEMMIENDKIEKAPIRIGAEQEFCLVDKEFNPKGNSLKLLKSIDDSHFTTEISNFNLEINSDPLELKGDCFSKLHEHFKTLLNKAKKAAKQEDTNIVLTGILPTLSLQHIDIQNMTNIDRYKVLNSAIKDSRKQDFSIHIKGVDELNVLHDSVMLEGCNTSFQMHLQVSPSDFVDSYNWSQTIAGPVLSICTNSPLLFGKELWNETRIALFTQSVDTRANSFMLNEKQSRVSFGNQWLTDSVMNIFKDNVSRFRSLVTSTFNKDSISMLQEGNIPKLKALNLHNGTVYRWNRACYGVGNGKPHLRIENRYIPSGPSLVDQIANFVFWVGLMTGKPKQYQDIHKKMNFKAVKNNFFSAARYGMAAQFDWNGKIISAQKLILDELLPMAYRGLYSVGITPKDAEYYLTIIKNRVESHNGSQWMINSYRNLLNTKKPIEALKILTAQSFKKQEQGFPVGAWSVIKSSSSSASQTIIKKVKHKMNTDIFSVSENDSIALVLNIMKWKNIHHMPVISNERELIGLLTWTDVQTFINNDSKQQQAVKNYMKTDIISIKPDETIENAKKQMLKHQINCLPVVKADKLIGILTSKDVA